VARKIPKDSKQYQKIPKDFKKQEDVNPENSKLFQNPSNNFKNGQAALKIQRAAMLMLVRFRPPAPL